MRRPKWFCFLVVSFLQCLLVALFFIPQGFKFFSYARNYSSELTYSATNGFERVVSMFDLQLPTIFHYLPYLKDAAADALIPAFKISKRRHNVSMVLGVPTVKREVESYLIATLQNLIENMNEQEKESVLIVVFIAEIDTNFVTEKAEEIQSEFGNEIDQGLLEIVAPPAGYYPDMDKLRITLDDPAKRVRWRTKQVLDYSYLMMYAQGKGSYYLQLEDDILTKPGYITTIRKFANKQNQLDDRWLVIEFSELGFIGKLYKSFDLSKFVAFFLIFYNDKPVDLLLDQYVKTKVCIFDKGNADCVKRKSRVWISYKPSLFQHVGTHSSLKGKIQTLTDKYFDLPGSAEKFPNILIIDKYFDLPDSAEKFPNILIEKEEETTA